MKTYYVYILLCADNSYYTGVTSDVERRVWEHNEGFIKKSYTHTRRPVKLLFAEGFQNPIDAISAEKQIKGWNRKKKEALMNNDFDLIHELASCKNETHHSKFNKDSYRGKKNS